MNPSKLNRIGLQIQSYFADRRHTPDLSGLCYGGFSLFITQIKEVRFKKTLG